MHTNQIDNIAKFESSVKSHELQLFKAHESNESCDVVDRQVSNLEHGTLTQALVESFAEATGWELAQIGSEIKIVDMSSNWPAMMPTAHRGKCDRFAEELSKLIR